VLKENKVKTPFASEKEYREHEDKEASKYEWAKHVITTLYPKLGIEGVEIGDVFESKDRLCINYYYCRSDTQESIPISCLWSENWEELIKEQKDEERREFEERKAAREKQKYIDVEKEERALLAELLEKYGDK